MIASITRVPAAAPTMVPIFAPELRPLSLLGGELPGMSVALVSVAVAGATAESVGELERDDDVVAVSVMLAVVVAADDLNDG